MADNLAVTATGWERKVLEKLDKIIEILELLLEEETRQHSEPSK